MGRLSFWYNGHKYIICTECGFIFCLVPNCEGCEAEHEVEHETILALEETPSDVICPKCEEKAPVTHTCGEETGLDCDEFLAKLKIKGVNE